MSGTHGSHELLEFLAAIVLSVGGGVILVRAALDRRVAVRRIQPVAAAERDSDARSTIGSLRRAETFIAVGLSAGAAAIHLAAGPAHVEELGDLGLGFYWAALFQAFFAVAFLTHPRSRRLAGLGLGVNLTLLGAWAWSRTFGLPTTPGGPESVGVADGTAVLLQVLLVALLAARRAGLDARLVALRSAAGVRSLVTSGLVAALGIIFLSTTIALADAAGGHGHGPGADDQHDTPALIAP